MMMRSFLAVPLMFAVLFTCASQSEAANGEAATAEELLDKAQTTLLWFYTLGDESVQQRVSAEKYREKISPMELLQAAALLHSFDREDQTALAEKLLLILPYHRITPEEFFEINDVLGDTDLRLLAEIETPFVAHIPVEANRFRTQQLNNAETIVLYQEPETALEVMKAIDVLSVVGRPVLVRHYLRRLLAGTPVLTPEESAKIVETLGTQKLMQIAVHPEFVPLGKEAVAMIIDSANEHWQDADRIAEALSETDWFVEESGVRSQESGEKHLAGTPAPRVRPEALPALRVLWKGDQLSVQQVFEKLATIEDEQEADQLVAVLLSLRPDMKEALAAALQSDNKNLRYYAARGLAASVTPQEAFLLYQFVFNSDVPEEERATVKNILQQRRISLPSQEQAAAILFERATDYFEKRRPLRIDGDGNVSFWRWNSDDGIEHLSWENIEAAYLYFAVNYYGQSYCILPKTSVNDKAYNFAYMLAILESLHVGIKDFPNPPSSDFSYGIRNLEEGEQLLQMTLEKDRFGAAFGVIALLGLSILGNEKDHTDLLNSTTGKPRVLVQAVVAPNREVRFAALEAIMKLTGITEQHESRERNEVERPDQQNASRERNMEAGSVGDSRSDRIDADQPASDPVTALRSVPGFHSASRLSSPFAGSSLVADTLVWFSQSDGESVLLSGHPQMASAMQTANLFLGQGYKTDVATTCRDLFRLAAASPDVEMVVVNARTPQPPVGEFVQAMRQDARTAEIPIAVLSSDPSELNPVTQRRNTMMEFDRRQPDAPFRTSLSLTYPLLSSEESARWVHDDLLEKAAGGRRQATAEERLEMAKQALRWLREIKLAELSTGTKIYHFEDFDAVVLSALHSERRVSEGLRLAAVVRSSALQLAIYEMAANAVYPMWVREQAAESFEESIERFGILLRGQQIQRLYDRYNASEFEPVESQELLSRLIDAVEENVESR